MRIDKCFVPCARYVVLDLNDMSKDNVAVVLRYEFNGGWMLIERPE
ncbi:hypothetical protein EUX98_g4321 [Antrodiella citrinella]|uniref:Uncharacterized protein n=1 Tax=Antrodiella citrinella TaxID=2447956 RepID=A0A4S4MX13_9APHY|nr:hypothetical protein EUX98_g4321 [Antrodiella citrinella]